ncbi:MAG: hypothetical protein IPL79_06160 [Myxococcales bacterium]|nr:hypothetical protein [Myxococcales bacterium]
MRTNVKNFVLSLAAISSLSGCIFEGNKCEAIVDLAAPTRNPYTGECDQHGGYGPTSCDGDTLVGAEEPAPYSQFPWAACYSQCEALDELTCAATSGCQAAYEQYMGPEDVLVDPTFWGCWATAENYLSSMQPCESLVAEPCTMRDDCSPIYSDFAQKTENEPVPPPLHQFAACRAEQAEQGCYGDQDCGEGFDCTADTECLSPPGCGGEQGCPEVCYGRCVPTEPPPLPGNCYGTVLCEMVQPACPSGTLPGIANDCWTGYCIPLAACESPACGSLGQAACESASSCQPIYAGTDCTCDASGCSCETLTYAYCNDA